MTKHESGSDLPLVVQFLHSGREYPAKCFDNNKKDWSSINSASHYRSFLKCEGEFIDKFSRKMDVLQFWGEWEGPAVMHKIKRSEAGCPKWMLTPCLPKEKESGLNTDPFVFNGPFRYWICKQSSYPPILLSNSFLEVV